MRVRPLILIPIVALAACGVSQSALPDLPADIPPPPATRADYDTASAAPCSFEDPLLNKYCGFGVKRTASGAEVYVTRPQGGTRKLVLSAGSWSTNAAIEAVRLSDGTSITVAGNEFYQISERIVLGE